jgi:hypothetical protein
MTRDEWFAGQRAKHGGCWRWPKRQRDGTFNVVDGGYHALATGLTLDQAMAKADELNADVAALLSVKPSA